MKQYSVSFSTGKDFIVYTFRENGTFQGIHLNIELNGLQIDWIRQRLFLTEAEFLDHFKRIKGCTIVQLHQKITFEMFWKKYDDPIRSSKKRTMAKWNKLSEADRLKAYYYIDTYIRNLGSAEKKYAETYLNAELWNN